MYDQAYIDSLPEHTVNEVMKMRIKARRELKHFKSHVGCFKCECLIRTVSNMNGQVFCAGCSKSFKGCNVILPTRKQHKETKRKNGFYDVKLSPFTCGGVNARIKRSEKITDYMKRSLDNPIPVVYSGSNTVNR